MKSVPQTDDGAIRYLRLSEVAATVRDSDLLLWRRRGIISIAGRGLHSHAAKAAWWQDDLFCLEMREFHGGRAVTLDSRVRIAPGRIDLYETNPDERWPHYDRAAATRTMRLKAGEQYSYRGLFRAALLHLPLARIFVRPNLRDDTPAVPRSPEFCSQACAAADRMGGGVDPVPNLGDRLTEPADLARSPFYRYRGTLIPTWLTMLYCWLLLMSGVAIAQPCRNGACVPRAAMPAPAAMIRLRHATTNGTAYGSGTIIEVTERGIAILSCAHLLDDGPGVTTRRAAHGAHHEVEVVAIDRRFDLCLLFSTRAPGDRFTANDAAAIAAAHPVAGESVRSCGFGSHGNYRCAIGQVLGYARTAGTDGHETLVVSGAARQGDSGGAIFNSRNELVAVLWGTDRTRIVGTYCGRIRQFLAKWRDRLRELLQPRAPPAIAPPTPVPPSNSEAAPAPPLREPLADRAPDLLLWGLSLAGISLSPWAVVGIRVAWKFHRRRRRRKRARRDSSRSTSIDLDGSSSADAAPVVATSVGSTGATRNDRYAEQLNDLMQSFGGRSTAQDATLGREYDRLLAAAESSSDAIVARFASSLRRQGRAAFERIHAEQPLPAEPATY